MIPVNLYYDRNTSLQSFYDKYNISKRKRKEVLNMINTLSDNKSIAVDDVIFVLDRTATFLNQNVKIDNVYIKQVIEMIITELLINKTVITVVNNIKHRMMIYNYTLEE